MPTCTSCGATLASASADCGACGARSGLDTSPTITTANAPVARAHPAARFLPGSILAGRYRIVSPLGRGGMGEVYRADDLKLGQPVALKFLNPSVARDPARHALLLEEVKAARQIAHPNVCRVWDAGEVDEQPFLCMEYVDGEDLGSLLRRIGRLPEDRAVQVARQICAGLAAVHEQGLLHRDLKPSNIMIDGRGRARLTDFGLATSATMISGEDIRSGTPAYMAPEQLAGRAVTAKSDIYSLGLVLYEMFTGHSAFPTDGPGSIRGVDSTPDRPSQHRRDLDLVIERALLRCLDPDPDARPASALAVAAALPGGDPVAAALAAGETPSPEMVAAAGTRIGFSRVIALLFVALISACVIFSFFASERGGLSGSLSGLKSPEILQERAAELMTQLGLPETANDEVLGFQFEAERAARAEAGTAIPGSRAWYDAGFGYWYMRSPTRLVPVRMDHPTGNVGPGNPPLELPGMASAIFSGDGRLIEFTAVPDPARPPAAPSAVRALLAAARVDTSGFARTDSAWLPPVFADHRERWQSTRGDSAWFELATYRGQPVRFAQGPPTPADFSGKTREGHASYFVLVLFLVVTALLARRNLHLGRGDYAGAWRLVYWNLFVGVIGVGVLANPRSYLLPALLFLTFCAHIFFALLCWTAYVALEPIVRRYRPKTLTSWVRLLDGQLRDPLVGRHILIGLAAGAAIAAFKGWIVLLVPSTGTLSANTAALATLIDGWRALGSGIRCSGPAVLGSFFVILPYSWIAGRTGRAWTGWVAGIGLLAFFYGSATPLDLSLGILLATIALYILTQVGLLASAAAFFVQFLIIDTPCTLRLGAWYADMTLVIIGILALMTLWGYVAATWDGISPRSPRA